MMIQIMLSFIARLFGNRGRNTRSWGESCHSASSSIQLHTTWTYKSYTILVDLDSWHVHPKYCKDPCPNSGYDIALAHL